ncbi:MAG: DUF3857 domain-containing protein [Candidatus Polarisedimenticolia bacterium]
MAAACLLLAAPDLSAARLPDWAHEIAASAPEAGSLDVGDSIYMLLSEERVAVQPDGTFRIRQRFATQILSSTQRRLEYQFPFNKDAVVETARAWHLKPGQSPGSGGLTPVDVEVEESTLTDQRLRTVQMQGLRRGSIVFFEFETSVRPNLLTLSKRFFEDAPVREARLELTVPEGWNVRHTWVRNPGAEPESSGDTRVWRIQNLPAPSRVPLGEAPAVRAPQLAVNMIPPEGTGVATPAVPDWSTFSAWYDELSKGAAAVTPEVEALAREVMPSAGGNAEMAQIQEAARWVRDNIRYVPPRPGVGASLLPRPAAGTMAEGHGDCKDMGTLLRALLASAGIRSYPLLVHASQADTLSEDVPAWGFDHYVVAVPLPSGAALPAHFAGAIVDGGALGPLLVVDTTHTDLSVGSLSAALAGKRGLVVAGRAGRLVTLPAGDAASHRIERTAEAGLRDDGALDVTVTSRLMGQPAVLARAAARASASVRRAGAEQEAAAGWPGARVTGYDAVVETEDGAFVETVTLSADAESVPAMRARLFAGADGVLPRVALEERREPVVYDYPRSVRYEVTLRGSLAVDLPEDSWQREAPGWSMHQQVSREDGTLHATWDLTLSRTRFEPDSFADLSTVYITTVATASAEHPF